MLSRRFAPVALALGLAIGAPASFALAAPPLSSPAVAVSKDAPEAPLPIGLPLAGLAVFGGYVWLVRRGGTSAATKPA